MKRPGGSHKTGRKSTGGWPYHLRRCYSPGHRIRPFPTAHTVTTGSDPYYFLAEPLDQCQRASHGCCGSRRLDRGQNEKKLADSLDCQHACVDVLEHLRARFRDQVLVNYERARFLLKWHRLAPPVVCGDERPPAVSQPVRTAPSHTGFRGGVCWVVFAPKASPSSVHEDSVA